MKLLVASLIASAIVAGAIYITPDRNVPLPVLVGMWLLIVAGSMESTKR